MSERMTTVVATSGISVHLETTTALVYVAGVALVTSIAGIILRFPGARLFANWPTRIWTVLLVVASVAVAVAVSVVRPLGLGMIGAAAPFPLRRKEHPDASSLTTTALVVLAAIANALDEQLAQSQGEYCEKAKEKLQGDVRAAEAFAAALQAHVGRRQMLTPAKKAELHGKIRYAAGDRRRGSAPPNVDRLLDLAYEARAHKLIRTAGD